MARRRKPFIIREHVFLMLQLAWGFPVEVRVERMARAIGRIDHGVFHISKDFFTCGKLAARYLTGPEDILRLFDIVPIGYPNKYRVYNGAIVGYVEKVGTLSLEEVQLLATHISRDSEYYREVMHAVFKAVQSSLDSMEPSERIATRRHLMLGGPPPNPPCGGERARRT